MPRMPTTTFGPDRHRARRAANPAPPADSATAYPSPRRTAPAPRVDAGEGRSVSFTPSDGTDTLCDTRPAPSSRGGHKGHALVAVGPGVPGPLLLGAPGGGFDMNPLPITAAKVHRPLLRADVLSRERLNGWLDEAVTGRLVLLVAEAGFGKTTLLADWSRGTRRRTAWYRLESDDRDWLTFIRHLVGSGRELDPGFAAQTYALLLDLGPGGPTQADLVASLVREFAEFGAGHPQGLTLILDDYHAIDRSDETEPIVRAILERTGPGFSVVIASRSAPHLPLGRLRARGGVARLDGDALCFDVPEADRLFRDAYHQPLEPDVVTELVSRTEGWPALLSLVRTNLEDSETRDPRSLVHDLSGATGNLYDYLAEELTATLSPELQQFLARASLLDQVEEVPAAIVDDRNPSEIRELIRQAERLGLLARSDPTAPHRFHPLVRDFLQGRLLVEIGPAGVAEMHRRLAVALEGVDWRSAAGHYLAADDVRSVERVIDESLEMILASGQFDQVRAFLDGSSGDPRRPVALLLRSRNELARGNLDDATELARAGSKAAEGTSHIGVALLNLATVLGVSGFPDEAMGHAAAALNHPLTASQRHVALATVSMWEARHRGNLALIADDLRTLAEQQDAEGQIRYASVTRLNLAAVQFWRGRPQEALEVADLAEAGFRACGAPEIERGAALAARATGLAYLRRNGEAQRLLDQAGSAHSVLARDEAALETARIIGDLGDLDEAVAALNRVGPTRLDDGLVGYWALVSGQLSLRKGDLAAARRMAGILSSSSCNDVAGELRVQLLRARVALAAQDSGSLREVGELRAVATAQRSRLGKLFADVLGPLATGEQLGAEIAQLLPYESAVLSMVAEELAGNLHMLTADARARVAEEAAARPERWRTALRIAIRAGSPAKSEAAALLSEVGTADDIPILRSLSAGNRAFKTHAVRLTRRLAPHIYVEDLGAVEILIGDRPLTRPLRRKVLGLLCFLISRPSMVATRDEVLDALWPDLGPDTASNSLHQTIYFLRRVFEPDFREGYSAGYVLVDGDVVSLNPDLIDSSSRKCWRLLADGRRAEGQAVGNLLATYSGKFALDFAYEEWASDYRDTLHAAVLATIERAIEAALSGGDNDRAIGLAHSVLALDPSADSIELTLLRAYKASGRQAAAAEQYAHYSSYLRDQLGIEPPRLDEV